MSNTNKRKRERKVKMKKKISKSMRGRNIKCSFLSYIFCIYKGVYSIYLKAVSVYPTQRLKFGQLIIGDLLNVVNIQLDPHVFE